MPLRPDPKSPAHQDAAGREFADSSAWRAFLRLLSGPRDGCSRRGLAASPACLYDVGPADRSSDSSEVASNSVECATKDWRRLGRALPPFDQLPFPKGGLRIFGSTCVRRRYAVRPPARGIPAIAKKGTSRIGEALPVWFHSECKGARRYSSKVSPKVFDPPFWCEPRHVR